MLVKDRIYGEVEITSPIIVELIESQALQRLKEISQQGLPQEYWPFPVFSRYEHCVGVSILLEKLGANLEEQIAGLLHDASHLAFSHAADWVMGSGEKENYQDQHHEMILRRFGVDKILEKHDVDISKIADFENWKLLDRESPYLCTDRIDYALREFLLWANPDITSEVIRHLRVFTGKIVFDDPIIAQKFGTSFLRCQTQHWSSAECVKRYYLLSKILKEAIISGIISEDDFFENDLFVIKKLLSSEKEVFLNFFGDLKNNRLPKIGITLHKKFRFTDPEVLVDNSTIKLSSAESNFGQFLSEAILHNEAGVSI